MNRARLNLRPVACGFCLTAAVLLGACNGRDPLMVAPSPSSSAPAPDLPSGPTFPAFTLRGRVTEAAPTSITQVYPATVTIVDGEHAGLSADVNAMGFYEIPDVRPGTFTVAAVADGFVAESRRIDFGIESVVNFEMMPVPGTLHYVLTGDVSPAGGTCSDGEQERACNIVTFPVHNDGRIEARLDWTPSRTADLDLALFRTGSREPIARSANRGRDDEFVRAEVEGGVTYELRITYAAGSTPADYTLTLDCPN